MRLLPLACVVLLTVPTVQPADGVLGRPDPVAAIARGIRRQPDNGGLHLTAGDIGVTVFSPNTWLEDLVSHKAADGLVLSPRSFSADDRADIVRVFVCHDTAKYQIRSVGFYSEQPRDLVVGSEPVHTGLTVTFAGCSAKYDAVKAHVLATFSASVIRALLDRHPAELGIRVRVFRSRQLFGNSGNSDDASAKLRPRDLKQLW
jgi:hypothetical protein